MVIEEITYQTLTFVVGLTAVLAGFGVVLCASPIYSALYLIGNMICLAVLYLLYHAEFIAAVQMIVYAGAVMILFIFIIALLGGKEEVREPSLQRSTAFAFIFLLFGELLMAATVGKTQPVEGMFDAINVAVIGNAKAVGLELFSRHLIPFELASVLLLVATIGIVCLAKFHFRPIRRRE
ncbi:MAG: NADH-quinone oxidoreductase subunit J [Nitrospinales bacterium]